MRRLLSLLACLVLVVGLASTSMAHAMELPEISVSSHQTVGEQWAEGHTPGDADQVPADGDKGYPHHHGGCHGDHFAAPLKVVASAWAPSLRFTPHANVRTILPRSTADPALRPPQA